MTELCDLGVMGLAVMGANLARNAARKGFGVALYNRHGDRTDKLMADHGHEGRFTPSKDVAGFVASLSKPRVLIIMVKAGKPVDDVIAELERHLEEGDIVIDGGNSLFTDTDRRFAALKQKKLRFIGMGVSGGEEGALEGPSMMPGGERSAYDRIAPMVTKMAAQVEGTPCAAYIGLGGAGHYVKMVHNGIEYADIQLIVESYDLMRHLLGQPADELAKIFEGWNEGDLESFLIEITGIVLAKRDDSTGQPLVDAIVDAAEQKGTGRWTAQDALELGVPAPSMTSAVYARSLSALRDKRGRAARELSGPAPQQSGNPSLVDDIRQALYASKVVAYAEGFDQLATASRENGWDLDLGGLATIWRGGCIIRARFLDRIRESYEKTPDVDSLLMLPYFAGELASAQDAWRRAVTAGITSGIPLPAFSSALAYYDGYRQERGPANLIQGLRDYFGAHTYRRLDRDGAFHIRWSQDGTEVEPGASLKQAAGQG